MPLTSWRPWRRACPRRQPPPCEVLRIRLRLPATPPTPCTNGCSRTGNEQMRYASLSFHGGDGEALASIADLGFTQDANGYATLIVGTGATIPSWVTPANGCTFLDLTASTDYQKLKMITMRHIIPAAAFSCAGQVVPYRMTADVPGGSLMGDYMPVADYPAAATLPQTASALVGPGVCDVFPDGQPGVPGACGVFPAPTPAIGTVVTQCHSPTCSNFVAQANPPVTIAGVGFGSFPNGTPFTGTSGYLRITDTTQNWAAGYTGNSCGISVSSWEAGQIQLVANVNQNGACPLAAGDHGALRGMESADDGGGAGHRHRGSAASTGDGCAVGRTGLLACPRRALLAKERAHEAREGRVPAPQPRRT